MPSPSHSASVDGAEGVSTRRLARGLLVLALLLALVRFVRLSHWSLWIDESLTYTDWHVGIEGGEIKNPAGYWLVARAVDWLGGVPDEYALRFLPALVGVATVPLAWLAFRRFAGDLRASAAALLLAASSWHVYWSQNARFYTFAQFVSLLGGWIYLAALARGSVARAIVGLVVAASAAAFHPSAVLLLPALVVAPFVAGWCGAPLSVGARRVARTCLLAGLLVALLGSKWAYDALRIYWLQKGTTAWGGSFLSSAASSLAHALKTSGFFVTPLFGVAAAWGAFAAWRRRDRALLATAAIVAVGFGSVLALSLVVRVSAQYVFYLLPWILLLATGPLAGGAWAQDDVDVEAEGERAARDSAARGFTGATATGYVAVLALPTLVVTGLYLTVRQGERPPWREAYQLVASRRGADDLVLGMHAPVAEYYLSPRRTDLRHPVRMGTLDYFYARDPERWAREARRAWFVVNPEDFLDWKPEDAAAFQRMLREECRLVQAFPLYVESRDLSVWVYVRD